MNVLKSGILLFQSNDNQDERTPISILLVCMVRIDCRPPLGRWAACPFVTLEEWLKVAEWA